MKKKGDIARYTPEEISAMLARGESRTDWAAVKAMTAEELEASIAPTGSPWAEGPRSRRRPRIHRLDTNRRGHAAPEARHPYPDRRGRARLVPTSRPWLSVPDQQRAARPLWRAASVRSASQRPLPHRRHDAFGAGAEAGGPASGYALEAGVAAPHELARSRVWISGDKPRI